MCKLLNGVSFYKFCYYFVLWSICKHLPAEKSIEPCPKHNRKCIDLMVLMGIVLVLMKTIMVSTVCDGFYWWDVKSYGKMPENYFLNVFSGKN